MTLLSPLGYEVQGSLLPSEGSTPLRGIFLTEGPARTTPFRLDRVDTAKARLTAMVAVESASVVVIDPSYPRRRPNAVDPDMAPHPAANLALRPPPSHCREPRRSGVLILAP